MVNEINITIKSDSDIVIARQKGRLFAIEMGFSMTDAAVISTAISEVARNIVEYAREGKLELRQFSQADKKGMVVIAEDNGPGIANIEKAMQDGYTTGKGLGVGLPGAKRLMDEFEIVSHAGRGTKITMKKWLTVKAISKNYGSEK